MAQKSSVKGVALVRHDVAKSSSDGLTAVYLKAVLDFFVFFYIK